MITSVYPHITTNCSYPDMWWDILLIPDFQQFDIEDRNRIWRNRQEMKSAHSRNTFFSIAEVRADTDSTLPAHAHPGNPFR